MLTLTLLRHAKSSWHDPALPDQDRPLNARGVAAAPLMGRAMAKHGLDPDLVLCSPARRTRDTLALVLPQLKTEPQIVYEDELYHATSAEMLTLLQKVAPAASQLLMVGHNPELQSFALDLIGSGPKHLKDRLEAKLPTAGLVAIRFSVGAWSSIAINSGKLELFLTPRDVGPAVAGSP
jgi:phosphohistidine phosphatase